MINEPYEPYEAPRGRSFGRWIVLSVIALVVIVALVASAAGGLGLFGPPVPTPTPHTILFEG